MTPLGKNLTKRAETILSALIDTYVKSGLPIGSKRLCELHSLPWSSATIRSEMASMERQGLLKHSHTSSGRIPTTKGIQYFVDHLLVSAEVSEGIRRRIAEEFERVENEPIHLIYIVSKMLSRFSQNVSVVQSVYDGEKNFMIAGKENILGLPEFEDSLKLKDFFRVLEEKEVQDFIFRRAITSQSVSVLIGADSLVFPYQELFEDVSVVTSSFGLRGRAMGTVGVVGPKRMDYRRMIPLVDYTARSVGRKLAEV